MTETQAVYLPSVFASVSEPVQRRATGLDISKYQTAYTPQPTHDFVVIRASIGMEEDYLYLDHVQESENVPLTGAYHYFRSGYKWTDQLNFFLDVVEDRHEFLALDFEKVGNTRSAEFAQNAANFVHECANETGKRVMFYSSPSVIQEWMFQVGVYWVRDYPDLWIAQWPFSSWNDALETIPYDWSWVPWLPAGCANWRIWQYSANGNKQGANNGVPSTDVDLDVFNGTLGAMMEWVGEYEPEPPVSEYSDGYERALDDAIEAVKGLKI